MHTMLVFDSPLDVATKLYSPLPPPFPLLPSLVPLPVLPPFLQPSLPFRLRLPFSPRCAPSPSLCGRKPLVPECVSE